MTSRIIPTKTGGSPRRQGAALRRLHRALEKLEAKHLAAAKQTRTTLAALMQYKPAELLAGLTAAARKMLEQVIHSHDDDGVDRAFSEFLKTHPDKRQIDRLFGSSTLPKASPTAISKTETSPAL